MRRWFLLLLVCFSCSTWAQFFVSETPNIVYTSGGGNPQLLDLYRPVTFSALVAPGLAVSRPAIVFVHGGGWVGGNKADFADWGRYYAAQGYVCISIGYRFTNVKPWPAQIDDAQAAVRWLRKNAQLLEVDPTRIGAVGASAGGHLVMLLGTTDTLNDVEPGLQGYSSKVQAVANYSGPTDMTAPVGWDPSIWALITQLAGVPWTAGNPVYTALSPYFQVTPDDAPMLIFHGDLDNVVPVDQARKMAAKMRSLRMIVKYYEFTGEGHGFTATPLWTSIFAINSFFADRLRL